jgi:hypothetical protein
VLVEGPSPVNLDWKHNKTADAEEHLEVIDNVGLLVDRPPGLAGLSFIKSSGSLKSITLARRRR